MRHVYLPIEHSDDDLALAGQVAECLESRSLYVTWSVDEGYQQPDIETLWRPVEPVASAAPQPPSYGVWAGAIGTVVALIAALVKPRTA